MFMVFHKIICILGHSGLCYISLIGASVSASSSCYYNIMYCQLHFAYCEP